MLFSGLPFLYYFLPAVLVCYFAAPRKLKNAVLFVFSLIFYGWGEPRYIVLMIVSIVSGFVFALMIEKKQNKKSGLILMWISVAVSLSFLLIFKYADFLIENVNQLPGVSLPLSKLSLPIGISFYTFQIISYTVDVWRGDTKAQRNIISFGTYVCIGPFSRSWIKVPPKYTFTSCMPRQIVSIGFFAFTAASITASWRSSNSLSRFILP